MSSSGVVYIDLDGTLSNPVTGFELSIRYACDGIGVTLDPDFDLTTLIGPPLRVGLTHIVGSDPTVVERAVALYRECYQARGWILNHPYDGVENALENLVAQGYRLALVTSKMTHFARQIVEHFRYDRYFEELFGTLPTGELDDKGDLLRSAIASMGGRGADGVMIGDRSEDVAAGRVNALRTLGVLYGFGSRAELSAAGADALCGEPAEIPSAVAALLARGSAVG